MVLITCSLHSEVIHFRLTTITFLVLQQSGSVAEYCGQEMSKALKSLQAKYLSQSELCSTVVLKQVAKEK